MTTMPPYRAGLAVVASDGLLGRVDELQAQMRSPSGASQDLIVRGSDGILRLVSPRMIERVTDDTIYLHVPGATVPILEESAVTRRAGAGDRAFSSDQVTIPVAEERLNVTTSEVELGVARVHKAVEEHLAHETVALAFEEIDLEHVPINRVVDHYPTPFMDGDVLVVPLVEEEIVEVVVRRQLRVREELRIRRVTRQRQETIEVPLRREQAEVTEGWHDTPQPPTSPDPLAAPDAEPSTPSRGTPPPTS